MVRIDPEERFSVEQCLEMGCNSGLFRRRRDGYIVVVDENPVVDNLIGASEDKTNTPTQKSHRSALRPGIGADSAQVPPLSEMGSFEALSATRGKNPQILTQSATD